jgi:hypothetical protein
MGLAKFSNYALSYAPAAIRYGGLSNHPLLCGVDSSISFSVAKRICYSRKHKFCYFRVPKAASSSILKSLAQSTLKRDMPVGEIQTLLNKIPHPDALRDCFVFTFVRHPVSRILSAFLDKSRRPGFPEKHPMLRFEPGTVAGFTHFLSYLEDGALLDDLHWAPQVDILPHKIGSYNFIGRFESFEADLDYCLRRINGECVSIRNSRPHRTDANAKLDEYVTARERRILERLYEKDFEQFYS